MPDLDRKIDLYVNHGGCPVKWAHQPKSIKDALHRIGMRPMMKQCWRNTQMFFLMVKDLDLEYHEGWIITSVGVPIQHAWLMWKDKRIDLTLNDDRIEYLKSNTYTRWDVGRAIVKSGVYNPVDDVSMYAISPFFDDMYESYKANIHQIMKERKNNDT